MKKRSAIILFVFVVIAGAAIAGYALWNKPFQDPLKGDAVKVTAVQLFSDFIVNETSAQKKYVPENVGDKKIEVTGEIKEIGKNEDGEIFYTLKTTDEMFGVKCIMDKEQFIETAKIGMTIIVRGFCDGYNMDVIVNRCKPVK